MPRSASSKRPIRTDVAPVKAPRSCPNNSLSTSVGDSAPQLTVTRGPLAAATSAVDRAGDELLARAGFAGHQHRRVGPSHLGDLIVQPQHGGRASDHVVEIGPVLERFADMDLLDREASLQLGDLLVCPPEGLFARCLRG